MTAPVGAAEVGELGLVTPAARPARRQGPVRPRAATPCRDGQLDVPMTVVGRRHERTGWSVR
jgi:hypothetical protein